MSYFPPPHPYPPERYQGHQGEATARFRPADSAHDLVSSTGSADYLATGSSTDGDFGLYRWNMGREPSGPEAHFHKTLSESFFVITGTVRLLDGTNWIDAKPGDFLYVPAGGLHGFRNDSGEPASMLILFAPGAPRELCSRASPRSGAPAGDPHWRK